MYKIIDDVVNWGIFLCVFQTTVMSVGVSNSFRKKNKNLTKSCLFFLKNRFKGCWFGFLIGVDILRIKCVL